MKLIIGVCLAVVTTTSLKAQQPAGTFAALVPNQKMTSGTGLKWYDLTYLRFAGDSLRMELMPVSIDGTDTIFSGAPEDMLAYNGTLTRSGAAYTTSLTLIECESCPFELLDFAPAASVTDDFAELALSKEDSVARSDKLHLLRRKELRIERTRSPSEIIINGILFRKIK